MKEFIVSFGVQVILFDTGPTSCCRLKCIHKSQISVLNKTVFSSLNVLRAFEKTAAYVLFGLSQMVLNYCN